MIVSLLIQTPERAVSSGYQVRIVCGAGKLDCIRAAREGAGADAGE